MPEINSTRIARYEEPQPPGTGPVEVPQQSLLEIIWRRRWTVILSVVLCLGAGFGYLLKAIPIYTSTSRLYVEQTGPKILATDSLGVASRADSYLYTQAELLKSTPIVAHAMELANARRLKTFQNVDNLVGSVKMSLNVQVGKKDDIVTVAFDSPHPQEAALVVNSVVDAYVSYHTKQKRSTASEVLKILQKEKEKRDEELDQKLQAMLDFKQANGALSFEAEKGNVILQQLARLSEALTRTQLEVLDAKAVRESARELAKNPAQLRATVESQTSDWRYSELFKNDRETRAQLAKLEMDLLLASQQGMGKGHRTVEMLELVASELRDRVARQDAAFAAAYVMATEHAWTMAQQKESELQAAVDAQQKLALDLNSKAAEYARLENDWKRIEKLCDIIDSRIKELNVTEDAGALNINVLEVARPEDKPTQPQRTRIMAMALVLGMMLGFGLALLRDWTDQRLRSVEEIAAILDVPVLGVVPHMPGKQSASERGQAVRLAPMSDIAEAYRTIRTAIYFGVPSGQAKTLLITSPAPGDGKSTTASNIAVAMAQAGQRILLIDADFRRPMVHRIYQVKDDVGLSSVMAGRAQLDQAIQHTAMEKLHVLPCGPIPPNPSEMLNSQAFAEILQQLGQQYDHIVLDSPPVMPVTDARILGALCDITILVLQADRSTRKLSELARDGLLSVGSRILGVVVNDVPSGRGRYGYYSGYGYRRYGHYGRDDNRNGHKLGSNGEAKPREPQLLPDAGHG